MIGALIGSLLQMGGAYGALRLKRLKSRLLMSLLCMALFFAFALIALIFLFVLAYMALAYHYGYEVAAIVLFSIAVLFCLGIWPVHYFAVRAHEAAPQNEFVAGLKSQLPSTLAMGMSLGRQTKNFSKHLFTPKKIALAILVTIVTAALSRPMTTYQLVKKLTHKDAEKIERKYFWSRYFR